MKTFALWLLLAASAFAQTTVFSCGGTGTAWGTSPCALTTNINATGNQFLEQCNSGAPACPVTIDTTDNLVPFWNGQATHMGQAFTWIPGVNVNNFTMTFEINPNYSSSSGVDIASGWAIGIGAPNSVLNSSGVLLTAPQALGGNVGASGENYMQVCCGGPSNNIVWLNFAMYCGALGQPDFACPAQPGAFYIVNANSYANGVALAGSSTTPLNSVGKGDGHMKNLGYPLWFITPIIKSVSPLSFYNSDVEKWTLQYNGKLLTVSALDETTLATWGPFSWYIDIPGNIGATNGNFSVAAGNGLAANPPEILSWTLTTGSVPVDSSTIHVPAIAHGARVQ